MVSVSHPYQINFVSEQDPSHKALNMENKNPSRFWKTSQPTEQARIELKFPAIRVHCVEIMTSAAPQIEIELYNKDAFGDLKDRVTFVPKTDLMTEEDIFEESEVLENVKLYSSNEEITKEADFTHMSVILTNPYHDKHQIKLGLTSLVIYGTPISYLERYDRMGDALVKKYRKDAGYSNSTDVPPVEIEEINEDSYSFISQLKRKEAKHEKMDVENTSSYNKRYENVELEDLTNNFKEFKKVKPNNDNPRRDGGSSPTSKHSSTKGNVGAYDADIQKALRESQKTYGREVSKKSGGEEYDMMDLTNTQEPDTRHDPDLDQALLESDGIRAGRKEVRTNGNGNKGVDDDIQKAIELSKKTFLEDQKKNGGLNKQGTRIIEHEEDGIQYAKLLDQYAEQEEALSNDDQLSYRSPNEKRDDEEMTEPLESMGDPNDLQDPNELQEAFENEMQEEKKASEEEKEEAARKLQEIRQMKNRNIETKMETMSNNESTTQKESKYWSYGSKNHTYNTQDMFKLTASELTQSYIQNELNARKVVQNKEQVQVQVTTSYENILKGVVFSLSGFVNPERQNLRDSALSMGARFRDELYDGVTTHLICSSRTTNKYELARKMKHDIIIVNKLWLDACKNEKKWIAESLPSKFQTNERKIPSLSPFSTPIH